jgi:hypothetical protein
MMREAVDERGMMPLVSNGSEELLERVKREFDADAQGVKKDDKNFDPLISMHFHWMNAALSQGGPYLMGPTNTPEINDGHYCPICEFVKHNKTPFDAKAAIGNVADQMQAWCRKRGLIPQAN